MTELSSLPAHVGFARCARRLWVSEGGHTETIFDCQFCPTRPLVLATASYDASVRLWHTDQPDGSVSLTVSEFPRLTATGRLRSR